MKLTHSIAACLTAVFVLQSLACGAEAPSPTAALIDAIRAGNVEEVQRHITAGTDVNAANARGIRPLVVAVSTANLEIVTLLVRAGADPVPPGRQTAPFLTAVSLGNLDMVKLFVTEGGVDVNAPIGRLTPLAAARRQPAIAAYLREQGAVDAPAPTVNPYDQVGPGADPFGPGPGARGRTNGPQILADPNAIRIQIRALPGLEESLHRFDVNATNEARGWRQRNIDNRTGLLRAVQKQFEEEMHFVRATAAGEIAPGANAAGALAAIVSALRGSTDPSAETVADPNAPELLPSIDTLVAVRAERYKLIYDALRQQRREELQEQREENSTGRGRGRSSRGRSSRDSASAYGPGTTAPRRRPGPVAPEPEAPALDPDTEQQLDAWLGANPEDKRGLLETVFELDLTEYDALHQVALQAGATKAGTVLAGLMLARQDRLNEILDKMAADDERIQRQQERANPQQDATTSRRGRRSR